VQIPSGTRVLVLTVSDGVAAGTRQDESGRALGDRLAEIGFVVDRATVPDDRQLIASAIRAAAGGNPLVVSTGGTGLTPRDVTPQATLSVVDYEVPGLAEAMRAAGRAKTPMADLSRGVVGVLGKTLIMNLPGSPSAAVESLAALEATLGHALETLAGPFDHDAQGAGDAARPDLPAPDRPAPAFARSAAIGTAPVLPPILPGLTPLAPPAPGDPNDPWRDMPSSPRDANDPWRDLGPGAVPDPDTEPGADAARGPEPPG
jgi:molybdenum cofactor biosynthesis protein B